MPTFCGRSATDAAPEYGDSCALCLPAGTLRTRRGLVPTEKARPTLRTEREKWVSNYLGRAREIKSSGRPPETATVAPSLVRQINERWRLVANLL